VLSSLEGAHRVTTKKAKKKQKIVHCNNCQGDRNQEIRKSVKVTERGPDDESTDLFEILQCLGCKEVSFLRTSSSSDDFEIICNEEGNEEMYHPERLTYFPPAKWRKEPKWLHQLNNVQNQRLYKLISEVYTAVHADSLILACSGARIIVDHVINATVGGSGGFKEGLRLLQEKGYISPSEKEVLSAAVEAGHASTHRDWTADKSQLEIVIDIVENLVQRVFILPDLAEDLKKEIPPRSLRRANG
jgi:hypothetical protein